MLDDSWSVGVGGKPWLSRGSVRGGSPSRQEIAGEGTLGLTDENKEQDTGMIHNRVVKLYLSWSPALLQVKCVSKVSVESLALGQE